MCIGLNAKFCAYSEDYGRNAAREGYFPLPFFKSLSGFAKNTHPFAYAANLARANASTVPAGRELLRGVVCKFGRLVLKKDFNFQSRRFTFKLYACIDHHHPYDENRHVCSLPRIVKTVFI